MRSAPSTRSSRSSRWRTAVAFPFWAVGRKQFLISKSMSRISIAISMHSLPINCSARPASAYFTGRECIEIAIEILDIDFEMRHCLRPIDQNGDATAVRHLDDLLDRVDGAERIRQMSDRNKFCPFVQKLLILLNQ